MAPRSPTDTITSEPVLKTRFMPPHGAQSVARGFLSRLLPLTTLSPPASLSAPSDDVRAGAEAAGTGTRACAPPRRQPFGRLRACWPEGAGVPVLLRRVGGVRRPWAEDHEPQPPGDVRGLGPLWRGQGDARQGEAWSLGGGGAASPAASSVIRPGRPGPGTRGPGLPAVTGGGEASCGLMVVIGLRLRGSGSPGAGESGAAPPHCPFPQAQPQIRTQLEGGRVLLGVGNPPKSLLDDTIASPPPSASPGITGKGSTEVKTSLSAPLRGAGRSKLDESCSVGRLMWGLHCPEAGSWLRDFLR